MTTPAETNGAVPEVDLSAVEVSGAPLIPGGLVGERFMDGEATEEDLALVMGAGSDTPETQAPIPSPEPVAPVVDPSAPLDPNALTAEQLADNPVYQELQKQQRENLQTIQLNNQRDATTQLDTIEKQYADVAARNFVEKDGLTQEVASRLAVREAQRERQLYETTNRMQSENKLRMETALLYSKQYGVPVESLMEGTTAKEMELMARLNKLEAGPVTAPNGQTEIPPQKFDNGMGAGGADPSSRLAAIGRGDLVPTEADRAYAQRNGFV